MIANIKGQVGVDLFHCKVVFSACGSQLGDVMLSVFDVLLAMLYSFCIPESRCSRTIEAINTLPASAFVCKTKQGILDESITGCRKRKEVHAWHSFQEQSGFRRWT